MVWRGGGSGAGGTAVHGPRLSFFFLRSQPSVATTVLSHTGSGCISTPAGSSPRCVSVPEPRLPFFFLPEAGIAVGPRCEGPRQSPGRAQTAAPILRAGGAAPARKYGTVSRSHDYPETSL